MIGATNSQKGKIIPAEYDEETIETNQHDQQVSFTSIKKMNSDQFHQHFDNLLNWVMKEQ